MKQNKELKVLLVDDSAVFRSILGKLLEGIKGVIVVGKASNGRLCLKQLAIQEVDLVLLDVVMPEMDGLEALKEIQEQYPGVRVVMVSGASEKDADITVKSLELGALDFVAKHAQEDIENTPEHLKGELERVIKVVKEGMKKDVRLKKVEVKGGKWNGETRDFDILAIGTSTGGPQALMELIPGLGGDLELPVVLVQHMPANFTKSLALHLDSVSALRVKEAEHGEVLRKGSVYVAQGGKHMRVIREGYDSYKVEISEEAPVHSCRPAVDVLFGSLAEIQGVEVLTMILTGMGKDGVEGVRGLKEQGGYSLVQDEKSSIVFGMPKHVIKEGLADEVLALSEMSERVGELVRRRSCKVV